MRKRFDLEKTGLFSDTKGESGDLDALHAKDKRLANPILPDNGGSLAHLVKGAIHASGEPPAIPAKGVIRSRVTIDVKEELLQRVYGEAAHDPERPDLKDIFDRALMAYFKDKPALTAPPAFVERLKRKGRRKS